MSNPAIIPSGGVPAFDPGDEPPRCSVEDGLAGSGCCRRCSDSRAVIEPMSRLGAGPDWMIRFEIAVRMTDYTTEITIEARQPMRETLMLDAFHA